MIPAIKLLTPVGDMYAPTSMFKGHYHDDVHNKHYILLESGTQFQVKKSTYDFMVQLIDLDTANADLIDSGSVK